MPSVTSSFLNAPHTFQRQDRLSSTDDIKYAHVHILEWLKYWCAYISTASLILGQLYSHIISSLA